MKKTVAILMMLNVLLMLFALFGDTVVTYAPTIGWIGVLISSAIGFVIAVKK
jgi:hypothetical protein